MSYVPPLPRLRQVNDGPRGGLHDPPPPGESDEGSRPVAVLSAIAFVVIGMALLFGVMTWAMAGRAGTTLTYVCQPGDTAVVRDGFGQHTPMCVTADGSTIYWPERVRVPTP